MIEKVEFIVVGAGVVGLAIARALAMAGKEVIILEAADAIGTGTSSRNSEVIHAGIYYAKNSLKAQLCVTGKEQLYEYCRAHNVGHKRTGKLIVATEPNEIPILHGLIKSAGDNGVHDLRWLEAHEAQAMEPELSCVAAVDSPSTGIVDSHGLMLAYLGDAESHGVALALNSPLIEARHVDQGFRLQVGSLEGEPTTIDCRGLINAAGLSAQQVAAAIEGLDAKNIPRRHLSRGCYFSLPGRRPFKTLIYPVPTTVNLGIHLTVDLDGQARFGPDAEWVDEIDYNVDPRRADAFYEAVRRYYPALPDGELQPAYAGIRPKIQAPGEPPVDFVIQGHAVHGINGLVNLFGMESPGLTSSLAIGDYVCNLLLGS